MMSSSFSPYISSASPDAGEHPPPPPSETTRSTKSTCTAGTVEGHHRFAIREYSKLRARLAVGEFVRSGSFSVAGYDWAVVFYPRGVSNRDHDDHAAVYVQLMTPNATAAASFELRFVCADSGKPWSVHPPVESPMAFSTAARSSSAMFGVKVEAMQVFQVNYIRRDRLNIDCTVRVVGKPVVSAAAPLPDIAVPPPDLARHLGKLLARNAAASHAAVKFDVAGELIPAHRLVLATRSPVFNAELYGPMSRAAAATAAADTIIKVSDMQPAVFKVLLGYIYTDTLSAMDDLDEDTKRELARHLLVAADRYDMDRLKLICGNMLARSLTATTVASTMALAERHGCRGLREACAEFVISMGMNDEVLISRQGEGDQLNCVSIFEHFFKEIGSFLKIHLKLC